MPSEWGGCHPIEADLNSRALLGAGSMVPGLGHAEEGLKVLQGPRAPECRPLPTAGLRGYLLVL